MGKRNSMVAVLDSLTQGDKDAQSAKAEVLATIPDPTWHPAIPRNKVISDREFNVRDDAEYHASKNKLLRESLLANGLEKRDPMSFSIKDDGSFKVLVGHLRNAMMDDIDAERTTKGDLPKFATVHGLVYSGLTTAMEQSIMADHIGRKNLNEFETCREIGEFIELHGITDAVASVRFGMDKNKISRYRMRYASPTLMAEYRKEKAGKDGTESFIKVGQTALTKLYSAIKTDRDAGGRFRGDGPFFRAAWKEFSANPANFVPPGGSPKGPASKQRTVLTTQADGCVAAFGDTPEIKAIADTLRYAAGDDVDLLAVRQGIKDYCDDLRKRAGV